MSSKPDAAQAEVHFDRIGQILHPAAVRVQPRLERRRSSMSNEQIDRLCNLLNPHIDEMCRAFEVVFVERRLRDWSGRHNDDDLHADRSWNLADRLSPGPPGRRQVEIRLVITQSDDGIRIDLGSMTVQIRLETIMTEPDIPDQP